MICWVTLNKQYEALLNLIKTVLVFSTAVAMNISDGQLIAGTSSYLDYKSALSVSNGTSPLGE